MDYKENILELIDLLPKKELKNVYYYLMYKIENCDIPGFEKPKAQKDKYSYLDVFSSTTKQYIIKRVEEGKTNIYHAIFSVIQNCIKRKKSDAEIKKAFNNWLLKNQMESKKDICEEIYNYCFDKANRRLGE